MFLSGREKVRAIKTVAMVATPTPHHLPGSTQGPVPTAGITQVSVLEPRVRAVALAQASSHRHNLDVSQGQGSVYKVLVPYVHWGFLSRTSALARIAGAAFFWPSG